MSSLQYYALLFAVTCGYFAGSKYIFDKVNNTPGVVIDELFHIPQGLEYCKGNFSYWNPKITTLPGLYFVSTAILKPHFTCNTYNLRFVNLLASCVNLLLFSSILLYIYGHSSESKAKVVLQALNLALLPPLFFFSHVYYTDTISLMFLLAFSRLCFMNRHKLCILVLGITSFCVRQTNIVWVGMMIGHKLLELLIKTSQVSNNEFYLKSQMSKRLIASYSKRIDTDQSKFIRYYSVIDVYVAMKFHFRTYFTYFFKYITMHDFLVLFTHSVTVISFLTFVYINGSIVVGDKKAHEATLHIPQLYYFLLFYGVFGLPYVLAKTLSTFKLIYRNKTFVMVLAFLMFVSIHFNTIVHPYLLADNRHYTFYIWNRWYGKYELARFSVIGPYIFLLFSLYDNLKDQNCISFLLPYSICLFVSLCFQRMIEVRYFLIPFIIVRLRFVRPSMNVVLFEFLWYLALNAITFHIFFTKEIKWSNFDYAQRVIW